ncbi:MAG TPA: hypothetical protein VGK36_20355 [Candidatus Angelobacter sp.]|jgi:hypothetical protein
MTAEIAILNRQAVALAADSAVTLQTAVGPPKIYNTNKLFSLSKYQPVAAMVYGNAEFMDVPWETAIKAYRSELATRSFGALENYGTNFLRFIERTGLFPRSQHEVHIEKLTVSWLRRLKKEVRENLEQEILKGSITKRKLHNALAGAIQAEASYLARRKKLLPFARLSNSEVLRQHREAIRNGIRGEFGEFAASLEQKLERLAARMLVTDAYWGNSTGLVISGYGTKDFFPRMRCFDLVSIVAGRLRVREQMERRIDIGFQTTASVNAFAQSEMVQEFMNGIDSDYLEFIVNFIGQTLLDKYPNILAAVLPPHIPAKTIKRLQKRFVKGGEEVMRVLIEEAKSYSRAKHSDPIVNIVDALPKEELAGMAEALVNLTSFKRHITHDAETVGGPIDVAVVSRGDGFVWIKRKHYFKKELNPQFFANYYRS